jgi:hypothetical protein
MGPLVLPLIGAGLSFIKNIGDKAQEDADRMLHAEQVRLSPWLHVPLTEIHKSGGMGTVMQGAGQGLAMQQNLESQDNAQKMNEKLLDLMASKPGSQVSAALQPTPMLPTPGYDPSYFAGGGGARRGQPWSLL